MTNEPTAGQLAKIMASLEGVESRPLIQQEFEQVMADPDLRELAIVRGAIDEDGNVLRPGLLLVVEDPE